jgi:hypothetical protein
MPNGDELHFAHPPPRAFFFLPLLFIVKLAAATGNSTLLCESSLYEKRETGVKMEAYGPGSGRPGNNVCVVGTGVTGLLAVKNLVEQGLSVRALEQSENLGGNWYHSMDTEQVSALPEMKVNMSKETVSGSDPGTDIGHVARETYQKI